MPTPDRRPPNNEGASLDADITPDMDAFGRNWAQQSIASEFSPEMAARLFPAPAAPPTGTPSPGAPPGVGKRLDFSAIPGAANDRTSQGKRLDFSAIPGADPGASRETPPASGGLYSEFMRSINRPEEEMFGAHTTWAGRVKDIPHDVVGYVRSGTKAMGEAYEGADEAGNVLSTFQRIVRGATGAIETGLSPAMGTLEALAGRPVAEHTERISKPASEQLQERTGEPPKLGQWLGGISATPKYRLRDPEQVSEEEARRATDLLSVAVPGIGVVKYGELAGRLRASPLGRGVERLVSPTTMSDDARTAEALIRGGGGNAARESATTQAVLDAHRAAINRLPEAQRLDFIDHVEGGPAAIAALPQPLQQLAGEMRQAFQLREARLRNLPAGAGADFIEHYFPHMWQDPARAAQAFGGVSHQGSGASLRARSIPTVADGIAQGLVPISTDPIEMSMRYINSIDRFIASEATRESSVQLGYTQWVRPRTVGASGHPQSYDAPPGWVQLAGRGAQRGDGSRLYAPEDFARVYNNWLARGVSDSDWRNVYNGLLRGSNAITALELTMSGYHAATMSYEAVLSQLASALQNTIGGIRNLNGRQILRGVGQFASWPAAPVRSYLRGRALEHVYLGQTPGTPDMARITNLLELGGGRAVGSRHARIQVTQAQNYWTAWRQGQLRMERILAGARDLKTAPIRTTLRAVGRAMDTFSHALFNVAIPRIKNGAFYETMQAWLESRPNATHAEQVRQARVIWDSIDNRFGEMVQDNIFWNQTFKQMALLAMRSYSWNMGTVREIAGGVGDIAAGRGAIDSPRAAYVIAMPMGIGMVSAVYQYLKTGEAPRDLDDLVAPRTGGRAPGASVPSLKPFGRSQQGEVEERAMLPGYHKDVFGWYMDARGEALNKIATGPRIATQLLMNKDWQGLPIANPEDSAPEWLKQYFKFALDSLGPITARQQAKGEKIGSAITTGERWMGVRPAPSYLQDPENYAVQQRNLNLREWKRKQNVEQRQQRLYGGTNEE
jgi:hypothetical protein